MRSVAIGRRVHKASKQCWGVTAGQAPHNSSNVGVVTTGQVGHNASVSQQNGDRSRYRSEKRKGNKKGAEMEEEYVGRLTCKICECVFCDEDDKLIECGICEQWECIKCSKMSEKQYDLQNDKTPES